MDSSKKTNVLELSVHGRIVDKALVSDECHHTEKQGFWGEAAAELIGYTWEPRPLSASSPSSIWCKFSRLYSHLRVLASLTTCASGACSCKEFIMMISPFSSFLLVEFDIFTGWCHSALLHPMLTWPQRSLICSSSWGGSFTVVNPLSDGKICGVLFQKIGHHRVVFSIM